MRVVSSASGIVVAETFDGRVPDGRELLYEQRFAEEYPYVVHDQIAAGEMREFQVLGLGYGLGVLVQSSEQHGTGGNAQTASSPSAGGYSFADVDRGLEAPVAVALGYGRIWGEISHVVDGVNAGTDKTVSQREGRHRAGEHRVGDTYAEVLLVQMIVWSLGHYG